MTTAAPPAPQPPSPWAERVSRTAGVVAITIGVGVLLAWAIGVEALTSVMPRFIVMLPNTAVGTLACGAAIILLQPPSTPGRVRIARLLACFVFVLGVLGFVSRMAGRDVAHVSVLFYDRVALHPYRPVGLMATNSTIVFILSSVALLLVASDRPRLRLAARMLATAAGTIAGVALVGHLYGARALYAVDRAAGMAALTATASATIQIGILFLRPNDSGVSLVTRPDVAGIVVRRLLPLTAVFPILLGMAWVSGREAGWFGRETGAAMYAVAIVAWFSVLLLYNARYIRDADRQRERHLAREQRARAAAEAANKAKGDFLAVMSHELRTPLNAIVGYAGILSEGISGPLTPLQQRDIRRIAESAQHLTNVVNDILTLARLESGKDDARRETVSVSALLDEVAGIVEPLARAKRLQFTCECDVPITVASDAHLLKQILINIAGNAVKFTNEGSVRITAGVDGDRLLVTVSDTGIGIAPEHLDRIFDEFWQVEQPLTRSRGGAGLGLTVSRHLARLLDADISVESAPGVGSTFSLSVPGATARRHPTPPATKVTTGV